jgi:DNA-binding CsgD family transcriptional regulator
VNKIINGGDEETEFSSMIIPKANDNAPLLSELTHKHGEIARRVLSGQSSASIAAEFGMGVASVKNIIKSSLFQIKMRELSAALDKRFIDINSRLMEHAADAVEVITRTMYTSKNDAIKLKAAAEILDRAGFGKVSKVETRDMTEDYSKYSDAELCDIIGKIGGRIKNVTPVVDIKDGNNGPALILDTVNDTM